MVFGGSCCNVILRVSQMKSLRRGQVDSVFGLEATSQSLCFFGLVTPGRELAVFTASFSDTEISLQLWLQHPVLNQFLFPHRNLTPCCCPLADSAPCRLVPSAPFKALHLWYWVAFFLSQVMTFQFTIFKKYFISQYYVFEAKGARMGT